MTIAKARFVQTNLVSPKMAGPLHHLHPPSSPVSYKIRLCTTIFSLSNKFLRNCNCTESATFLDYRELGWRMISCRKETEETVFDCIYSRCTVRAKLEFSPTIQTCNKGPLRPSINMLSVSKYIIWPFHLHLS